MHADALVRAISGLYAHGNGMEERPGLHTTKKPKILQDFLLHRILQYIHGILNIDKKDN